MPEVTSYNPDDVTVILNNDLVVTGFADETAIDVAYNEDLVSAKTGIKGDTMYTTNGNRSGNIKLVLFNTSASLMRIRAMALAANDFPVTIRNAGSDGGYLIAVEKCRILRAPGVSHGKEGGTQEINIYVPTLVINEA